MFQLKNSVVQTFVKIPTPHSMPTLVKKRSSASNLSLNPPKLSSHRRAGDFSSSKYLKIIEPGIRPASIAAAKSLGMLSNDLPVSAKAIIASDLFLSPASPLPSPPPPPLPPPLPPPPPTMPPLSPPLSRVENARNEEGWNGVWIEVNLNVRVLEMKLRRVSEEILSWRLWWWLWFEDGERREPAAR